ncbi:unnamed protein product, partial [Meganyctiphanes norvegica]
QCPSFSFKMQKTTPWQDECETPSERIAYVRDTDDLADINIFFPQDDVTIKAHKFVLGISSPIFMKLLYGSFSEASEGCRTIKLHEDSSQIFEILLDHIYKGFTPIKHIDEAQAVYAMAHKYDIKSLMCACFEHLKTEITTENILKVYEFAVFYEESELLKRCLSVINTSADMVMSFEKINNISEDCMMHLLKNDAIEVSSEVIMFKALNTW